MKWMEFLVGEVKKSLTTWAMYPVKPDKVYKVFKIFPFGHSGSASVGSTVPITTVSFNTTARLEKNDKQMFITCIIK